MLPFAWDIGRQVRRHGVAVWRLHYRYRGWNEPEASPVADARWALDEVRRRHGDVPVVLLGHSMGGRVAVRVADDMAVRNIVLLAPWLPVGEPVAPVNGRRVLILHGDRDRTTSLAESEVWAARAATASAAVRVRQIRGGEHTMLRHARLWHSLAAQGVIRCLAECSGSADR
jgi:alpha-beta hydrolase superfamily lysophospholipase